MEKKSLWIMLLVAAACFIGGFLLANSFNRGDLMTLRAENERLKASERESVEKSSEQSLSAEEIDRKLVEAKRNSSDFQYQKNLGLALYRYGAMKQDPDIIEKVLPVLERASSLNSEDRDVLVGLGNAHFDIGYYRKENESFEVARRYYRRALAMESDDPDVRTDLGLTYFLQQPADLEASTREFRQALQANSRHEKSLQFIIQALVKQGRNVEAAEFLDKLRATNPQSPSINELASLIKQGGIPDGN